MFILENRLPRLCQGIPGQQSHYFFYLNPSLSSNMHRRISSSTYCFLLMRNALKSSGQNVVQLDYTANETNSYIGYYTI
jgi:hypothetical protein